jgi:hypothetical protein
MELMPKQTIARVSLALHSIGALVALAFVFPAVDGTGVLLFGLWAASPFIFLGLFSYLFQKHAAPEICLAIAAIPLVLSSACFYSHISRDAQGGLIFVVLPFYQLLFSVAVAIAAFIVFMVTRKRKA